MRKYLDNENATLEISLKNVDEYKTILNKLSDDIILLNFKRLILNIKENKISDLINIIPKKILKNILVVINTKITKEYILNYDNIILFNYNKDNMVKEESIYNVIDLDEEELIKTNTDKNIIINPKFNNEIITTIKKLEKLMNEIDLEEINVNGFLLPTFMLKEHPCNAYLCNGWKCKKAMSALPKYIYINDNLDLYPHDLFYDKLIIGNVKNKKLSDILEKYYLSDNYNNFIKYSKKSFVKYLAKYPYYLFPLIEYIRLEVNSDEK